MTTTVGDKLGGREETYRKMLDHFAASMRVSIPGIVQSFDSVTQTVTVQPALRERILQEDLTYEMINLPLLLDVPICFPRAGGYVLTMPVIPGDECLVLFSDMCIDAWFSSGGIQNQIEKRRHDLSDAFAIMGTWSQPRKISNYSTTTTQLRTEDGSAYISLSPGEIDLVAPVVKINGLNVNTHTHTAPNGGGTTTGPL